MSKNTKRGLLALSLALVLFPLATHKPGLPVNLKADEPAYYMMALSLAHDFDLRCELQDIRRGFDEFPYLPHKNFILMTDDEWETTYFGKPFVFSLFVAPLVRFFGANGIVSFNMLLLSAMMWMGVSYLRRFNDDGLAAIFCVGFFLLSNTFSYCFWLQPELFNMASGMLCLYLAFRERGSGPRRGLLIALRERLFHAGTMPLWSGAALALSVYNKPVMAALALPVIFGAPRKEIVRRTLAFAAGGAIVMGLLCGFSVLMTGHPSAYLGVARVGVTADSPDEMPVTPGNTAVNVRDPKKNSWSWIFRVPKTDWVKLWDDVGYFLWGRHTGLFPYQLFAWVAMLLFLLNSPRSLRRWWLVASLVAVAVFYLIWIPFNWHGGGGFIGNRYFVNVYPGFLFLVTRIRPAASTLVGYALGGLYLGPMLLTPFGAPVPEPTLQAHVRGEPFRLLPLEFSIRSKVPGYRWLGYSGLGFGGRRDALRGGGDSMWVHGADSVEIFVTSTKPIESAVFEVTNHAPGNEITLRFEGDEQTLRFAGDAERQKQRVTLRPGSPKRVRGEKRGNEPGDDFWLYRLIVDSATGQPTRFLRGSDATYYLGAEITYLGSPSIWDEDIYHVDWIRCDLPAQVIAGETFAVPVLFRNTSSLQWPNDGALRVSLSYHWLDEAGEVVVRDGKRTRLRRHLMPGKRMKDKPQVLAPASPGTYTLEIDPIRERVAWFSERNPEAVCRGTVEVLAPDSASATANGATTPVER